MAFWHFRYNACVNRNDCASRTSINEANCEARCESIAKGGGGSDPTGAEAAQQAIISMPGPSFFGQRQPKSSRRQQGRRTIQRRTYRR